MKSKKKFTRTSAPKVFANENIRAQEVRLIDESGEQMGVMSTKDALQVAKDKGVDLIQITEKADPPVAKLGDYGKALYQKEKKARENRKRSGGELKEVKLTFNISSHDMETRAKQAVKFLNRNDRVRITLPLRGRQKALEDHAREKIQTMLDHIAESVEFKQEKEVRREPRGLSLIIVKK